MNKLSLLRTFITTGAIAILILIAGTEVFQGNEKTNFQKHTETVYDYDETDPYIDRPTSESRLHLTEGDDVLDVITDGAGFDNFEIGVDNAEQMLVSNPTNPLNMQFGVNGGGGQNAYYTTNGHDWTLSNPAYHPSTCCDPWSAFDSLGNLYYGSGVSNQYVYKSLNGGQTYGPPVLSVSGNDRNTLAADQTNGPYKSHLYAAITPGNFARSTNSGTSWTTTYSPSNTIPGTMIAVGPNGATQGGCVMYVTNTGSTANVTYTFHRSLDGGATFSVRSSLTVAGYVGSLNTAGRLVINNGRTRPYPMIAMDNSYGPNRGRLYLVYASNVPAGNGNKPDIILQYSNDQGATWSTRRTVNDNANPQLSDQWFPAIWCEKETGRLYIKWYDTRENPATYAVNVYATYTDDGGATFAANQKLTTTSWTYPNPACPPNTNCYRGDYDGMTANPKTSYSVWYDGRLGTYKNVGAYFPDYAMTVSPTAANIHNTNDFKLIDVNVPAVKLYTDVVNFTTAVTPAPGAGSIVADFPSGNSLSAPYPKTAKMRVRTIGTVTNGVYTVTVTGSGPNGTPVHKRTVSVTVGNTLAGAPCEDFTEAFPPTDLGFDYTGDNYWSRNSQSAYGTGTGSARFNAWSAPAGTNQALVSMSFTAVGANTYLTFDNAYRPWTGGNIDSLIVESSSNFGGSYTTLEKLWGGLGAQAGPLNTVFTGGGQFSPLNHQWRSKIYLLPAGTNKIRLRAVSGFGNDIFVDNVCVQSLSVPSTVSSIGLVPEGFYRALPFPQAVPDTARIYLHRTDFPNIAVDSAISYFNAGAIASSPFTKALSGTYYIVLKHRNSIDTWSKSGGEIYTRGNTLNFNFIQPSGQAYNNNQALIATNPFFGMYGGDVNRDFSVDIADVSQIENAAANFLAGYVVEDVTADNFVDINDQALADNNASNFVTRQTPPGADLLGPIVSEEVVTPTETNFENDAMRQKHELTIRLLNDQKAQEKISVELKKKKDQETELRKKKINSVREKMRSKQNKSETVKPEIIIPDRPGRTLGQ